MANYAVLKLKRLNMRLISILCQLFVGYYFFPAATCWVIGSFIPVFIIVYLGYITYYYAERTGKIWLKYLVNPIYLLDLLLNIIHMTVIYQQLPHSWRNADYSSRLRYSAETHRVDGYRFAISEWIYYKLMHKHDPDHNGIDSAFKARLK